MKYLQVGTLGMLAIMFLSLAITSMVTMLVKVFDEFLKNGRMLNQSEIGKMFLSSMNIALLVYAAVIVFMLLVKVAMG